MIRRQNNGFVTLSYFSVLKVNTESRMQVYKLTALPFFIPEKETATELFGLPKIVGVSTNGYLEWQEVSQQSQCDFGDYTVCRDPPIVQKRINNMCLEQLISTNRSFHCRVQQSFYTSPYFRKISRDVLALSTRTVLNCSTPRGYHIFNNLSIIQLGCTDSLFCANNINLVGDKRCVNLKPYMMKTADEEIIPVVESIRPLNISLPTVYPFASDKNLVLTLEEQMKDQQKNMRETAKTGEKLTEIGSLLASSPTFLAITVTVAVLSLLALVGIVYLLRRCFLKFPACPLLNLTIGTTIKQPSHVNAQPTQDNLSSLEDLFHAFAQNKTEKKKDFD